VNLIVRRISIIAAAAVLILSVFISKTIGKKDKKEAIFSEKQARLVSIIKVNNTAIPANISVTGKLAAAKRIELFAEVNGLLLNNNFKEGVSFASGSQIAIIDDAEARAQIKAQKATFLALVTQSLADLSIDFPEEYKGWKRFQEKISFDNALPNIPEVSNAQVKSFLSGRNIYTNYFNIKSQELRLAKYRITAPFSGVLSNTTIDPGALVRIGQKMGEFINLGAFELEAPISLSDIKFVKVGDKVQLKSNDIEGTWTGTIARINQKLDATSQSLMLYIQVQGPTLKEGMFLNASIKAQSINNAIEIPRKLLFNGNKLYVLEHDSILKMSTVQVVRFNKDNAVVVGIPENTTLFGQLVPGSYESMVVKPLK
jgi:membrane fusion protein (multidrug efflux system)